MSTDEAVEFTTMDDMTTEYDFTTEDPYEEQDATTQKPNDNNNSGLGHLWDDYKYVLQLIEMRDIGMNFHFSTIKSPMSSFM